MNCLKINKMSQRLQFLEGDFTECRKIKNDLHDVLVPDLSLIILRVPTYSYV